MSELDAVKVGDKLYIDHYGEHVTLLVVDRITPTQIVCGYVRIRRKDGHVLGTYNDRAVLGTPDLLRRRRLGMKRRKANQLRHAARMSEFTEEELDILIDVFKREEARRG